MHPCLSVFHGRCRRISGSLDESVTSLWKTGPSDLNLRFQQPPNGRINHQLSLTTTPAPEAWDAGALPIRTKCKNSPQASFATEWIYSLPWLRRWMAVWEIWQNIWFRSPSTRYLLEVHGTHDWANESAGWVQSKRILSIWLGGQYDGDVGGQRVLLWGIRKERTNSWLMTGCSNKIGLTHLPDSGGIRPQILPTFFLTSITHLVQ